MRQRRADNSATADGGGLFVTDSTDVFLSSTVVSRNTAAARGGGTVLQQRSSVGLDRVLISQNVARDGGGMFVSSNSDVTLGQCAVTGNVAHATGGGIAIVGSLETATRVHVSLSVLGTNRAFEGGATPPPPITPRACSVNELTHCVLLCVTTTPPQVA